MSAEVAEAGPPQEIIDSLDQINRRLKRISDHDLGGKKLGRESKGILDRKREIVQYVFGPKVLGECSTDIIFTDLSTIDSRVYATPCSLEAPGR